MTTPVATDARCASCDDEPRGLGGILGEACRARISSVAGNYWGLYEVGTGRQAGRVVPRTTSPSAVAD